jgi:hypothetical protein
MTYNKRHFITDVPYYAALCAQMMMQAVQGAIVVMPYVDDSGALKVCASDSEGKWNSNVDFVPGRLSKGCGRGKLECRFGPWKNSRSAKVEKVIVNGINPTFLPMAMRMIQDKMQGLLVNVTDSGVELTDISAYNREKIEVAKIWLCLAGQYAELKCQFELGCGV